MRRHRIKKVKAIKRAIKELANNFGYSMNSYHKISNDEILDYMITKRIGVQWVTLSIIKRIRPTLPKMYQEKNNEK